MLVEGHGFHAKKEVFKWQGCRKDILWREQVAPRKCSGRTWVHQWHKVDNNTVSLQQSYPVPESSCFLLSSLPHLSLLLSLPACFPPPLLSMSPAPTTSFPFYFLPPFPPHDLLSLSCLLPSSSCLCSSHLSSFSSFFSSRNLALIMEGSGAVELIWESILLGCIYSRIWALTITLKYCKINSGRLITF